MRTRKKALLILPANKVNEQSPLPPLGLATIAAYIPDEYDIRLIDESFEAIDFDADIALISSVTLTSRRAYEIAAEFRKRGIPTVLGGIHASLMPEEAVNHVDSVVVGNGENVMAQIFRDFENNSLQKIYRPPIFDLAHSLPPRRDLISRKHYTFDLLETTRGCPFDCDFCSVTIMNGKQYRYKDLKLVRADLETLTRKSLLIADDNIFGSSPRAIKRAMSLFELLQEYSFNWVGQTTMDIADHPEALKAAKKSGAACFYIGFESINTDFLKAINKSVNVRKGVNHYTEAIKKIHDAGIAIIGSFIVGTDFDTPESLEQLDEFIQSCGVDAAYVKPLVPLPGTRLYQQFKEKDRFFRESYWLDDPLPLYTFKPEKMNIEELHTAFMKLLEHRKPSRSIKNFARSLWSTGNLAGAYLILALNLEEYRQHRVFMEGYLEKFDYLRA